MNRNIHFAALVSVGLILGCESKPANTVPETAPMAAKQPHEILNHLKYMAVKKDPKHAAVLAPEFQDDLWGNAWWFHKHAGEAGIPMTDEEITTFGLQGLKEAGYFVPGLPRLDLTTALDKAEAEGKVPPTPKNKKDPVVLNAHLDAKFHNVDKEKLDLLPQKDKAAADYDKFLPLGQKTLNSGLYRLMKGVPTELWNDVVVMDVKPDADPTLKMVYLGIDGTPILHLNVKERKDKTYGLIYVQYKVSVKKLEAVAKKRAEAARK